MSQIPKTMRAIKLTAPGQFSVAEIPTPQVQAGSVLIKVEAAMVQPQIRNILNAVVPHLRLPYPVVPGSNAIGRVVEAGPDAVVLEKGQLVLISSSVRARDDPSVQVVWGVSAAGFGQRSEQLYAKVARNGSFAEYLLAPLENTCVLDERRLLGGGLGYKVPELLHLSADAVSYAGLRSIDLQAGERIIVTPATGFFSTSAVDVAVAMGANVVAASRNGDYLARLKTVHPEIETVRLTGTDFDADKKTLAAFGPVDAVVDISPPSATGSNNLAAAVATLRPYGRVSLLGGRMDPSIPISYMDVMWKSLKIQGSLMYTREDQLGVIKLVESGRLKLGKAGGHEVVASYPLDRLLDAADHADKANKLGQLVCLEP
ncbi:hypothetical protein HRR83_003984 [Exophiala dermatitidis]|uniref:Alcohol dehydrogenase n=2 Tax=Exophiala dermatitidis TaxID=5970 RepID=H6BQA0_EXODN|nr:alcohol dehydrogenase [Exophiala dermatitidis NIH/UT8656]KAJ4518737.1 hypothetical protein HRR75_002409 [Exophiala dermatitidis]EHY53770.1 alcohol dehydrogenase [Exophiala dermatitidis NIH/UT8656]KAJ4522050.1 hypothetical protein HRR74_002629 [Exophiala dermatitidis]KAJ4529376.1 hypothetical protein HRR73_000399 [Exophiala dermatitidis]KAJ4543968.1 hypothetical protein HRR76_002028 [Exophiala dermatitidis]